MELTEQQKKLLRGLGHQLKPVLMVGDAGQTEGGLRECSATMAPQALSRVGGGVGDR